jgi:hypothetical protein
MEGILVGLGSRRHDQQSQHAGINNGASEAGELSVTIVGFEGRRATPLR